MPVRMTKEGRAETREDKRSEQANQQAVSAKAAISPSEGKGSTKAKEPKSPTERKNEKKAQIREARMTSTAKRYGERYTPGMLTGGQAKIAAKAPPPNVINEKDFAVLRAEKAKGRGMGLQDEKVKPGKVQKANLGLMFMKKAKDKGAKGAEFLSPLAMLKRLSGKKAGGVMKARVGKSIKKDPTKTVNPFEKKSSKFMERRKKLGTLKSAIGKGGRIGAAIAALGIAGAGAAKLGQTLGKKYDEMKKKNKKMGGGMMQKPMGYSTGGPSAGYKSKEDRKKAEKNIKQARSKEGLRSFLSSGNKINQPMRKERYMEGRKARHSAFKKKLGRTAAGIASSLNPVTTAARVIGKVMGKGSKKRDFQKGDYGDISVKKMGGGMMQKPMGYNKGVMVKARGCKLGRTRPTKIT